MTPFITYTLLGFMGLYLLILLHELITSRAVKRVLAQTLILCVVFVVLHLAVDFPIPKQAFGGASPAWTVVIVLVCTILGMAAHGVFFLQERAFVWREFVRPFVISPIVLLPLLGSVLSAPQITTVQVISFAFLAFQNGFFWKEVLKRAQAKTE